MNECFGQKCDAQEKQKVQTFRKRDTHTERNEGA